MQPVVIPVWFITPGFMLCGLVWQRLQAWLVGMWLLGLPPLTPVVNDVVDVWHVEHSPEGGWPGSCAAVGRVTMVTPKNVLPVS